MYRTQGSAWYPLFSTIFRYRTCMPDTVKYGISNLTVMGARLSSDSCSVQADRVNKECYQQNRNDGHTSSDTGKTEVRAHEELAATVELLDLPYKRGLVWHIRYATR